MAGPLTEALDRWKAGDDAAQFELMHELQPLVSELIRLVQRSRATDLKKRIESEGIVNAGLKSFFSGARKAEFPVLQNTEHVRTVLYSLVRRTLSDEIDRHRAQKRSTQHELPIESVDESQQAPAVAVADLVDKLEKFKILLRDVHPMAMSIWELLRDGLSKNDIATELGLSLRTVQLIQMRMLETWDSQLE